MSPLRRDDLIPPHGWGQRLVGAVLGGGLSLLLSLPLILGEWLELVPPEVSVLALMWGLVIVPVMSGILAATVIESLGGPRLAEWPLIGSYLLGVLAPSALWFAEVVWPLQLALWLAPGLVACLSLPDRPALTPPPRRV